MATEGQNVPYISEADVADLTRVTEDKAFRRSQYETQATLDYLKYVKEKVKDIKGFWPFVFTQHQAIAQLVTSSSDKDALSYLTDIQLVQDPKDPRPYEIIFHFAENPYFTNKSLTKKYTLKPGVESAPLDGSITEAMRRFEPRQDLVPDAVKIDWTSSEKDLCSQQPRVQAGNKDGNEGTDDHEVDFDGDMGSFFWFFADASDPFDVGSVLQGEILPEVFDFYTGEAEACIDEDAFDDEDEEDELDEEDGDEDEEIDLEDEEEPSKKKRRTGGR